MFWEGSTGNRNHGWRKELASRLLKIQILKTKNGYLKAGEYRKRLYDWPVKDISGYVGFEYQILIDVDEYPKPVVLYKTSNEGAYKSRLYRFFTKFDELVRKRQVSDRFVVDKLIDHYIFSDSPKAW